MMDNDYKIDGNCEICGEPIKKGDLTLHKSGKYLCAKCQIDLNREMELREIYIRRRIELLNQLHEIDIELGIDNTNMYN